MVTPCATVACLHWLALTCKLGDEMHMLFECEALRNFWEVQAVSGRFVSKGVHVAAQYVWCGCPCGQMPDTK